MNTRSIVFLAVTILCLFAATPAWAGSKSKAAQEAAEYLFKQGSKEVVEHGVEAFARKVETIAMKHGDDVFRAVKAVGPQALPLIERAGSHGGRAAKILATHGEHAAVLVVSRPSAMSLVAKHGDVAALALVKHPGIAEPLVEKAGGSAIAALTAVGPQAGRRLAILAEGETAHIATHPKVLEVIARFGDRAMDFVWKHKGSLVVTAALAAFVADPEPFITGGRDITKIVAENAVKPLAEASGRAAENAAAQIAPEVGRNTNWTVVFIAAVGGLAIVVGLRMWLTRRPVIPFQPLPRSPSS